MELLAVSTGVAIAYAIGLWFVLIIGPVTVTALKGQWPLFNAGFTWVGLVWMIAAFRLARPESWWARRLYGPAKLARAEARYPETLDEEEGIAAEPDPPWVRVATALFLALCAVAAILALAWASISSTTARERLPGCEGAMLPARSHALAPFWRYPWPMPSVQIKNVPADVHRVLRRRAAAAGQSMQEYLLAALTRQAGEETLDEVLDRAGGRAGGSVGFDFASETQRADRTRAA